MINQATPDYIWTINVLDNAITGATYSSVATDSSGNLHISYADGVNLKYATNASGSWVVTTIDNTRPGENSLAIDPAGKIHISYKAVYYVSGPRQSSSTVYEIRYATNVSGLWSSTTVDTIEVKADYDYCRDQSDCNGANSIAVDSSGNVHISYFDVNGSNMALKYATNASGLWKRQTIDIDINTKWNSAIAVDSSGKAHISYLSAGDDQSLRYASNSSGSWVVEILDIIIGASYVGDYTTSIATDSSGKVHISYTDGISFGPWFNKSLNYATNSSGIWVFKVIDPDANGSYNSIAIDSSDRVHIGYTEGADTALKYATNSFGLWQVEVVDNTVDVCLYPSIAIDPLGYVHLSYYDSSNTDLKYATNRPVDLFDNDGDGYTESQGDCNDGNPAINLGASDTTCNGIDENCSGAADEGYVPTPTNCGIGECASTGQLICQNGSPVDTCTPGQPQPEVCDNKDNDCDGFTDDNLTRSTSCGIGECARTGIETCTSGEWDNDTCTPGQPQAEGPYSNQTCSDTRDNDCDGLTDTADNNCMPVDLIVSTITAPTTAGEGQTITVTDTTRNIGTGLAGESTTKIYWSTNSTYGARET